MALRFWFFYDDNYQVLGEDQWYAGLLRLAQLRQLDPQRPVLARGLLHRSNHH